MRRQGYHQWRGPKYISLHEGRDLYSVPPWRKLPSTVVAAAKMSRPTKHWIWRAIGEQNEKGWNNGARFPEGNSFPGKKHFFDVMEFVVLPPSKKRQEEVRFARANFSPYAWTPHHLIPAEHVSTGTPPAKRPFSDLSLEFIDLSFWELDNGHNLILLPRRSYECAYHCLPAHAGSHPQYSLLVFRELQLFDCLLTTVARELKEQDEGNQKEHADFLDVIVDSLYEAEDQLWNLLKRLGQAHVSELILRGQGPQHCKLLRPKGRQWGYLK